MKSVVEKNVEARRLLPTVHRTAPPESPDLAPAAAAASPDATHEVIDRAELEDAVLRVQISWGLGILAGIACVSFVTAGALLGRATWGLGTFLFTIYFVLFGMPFWIAAMDTEGDEKRKALLRSHTGTPR